MAALTMTVPKSLATCLMNCQNSTTSSSGTGGSQQCATCLVTGCPTEAKTCYQDNNKPGCKDWITCVSNCSMNNQGADCFKGCDTTYASAAPLYDPIYACACTNCSNDCSVADPCNHPNPTGAGGAGATTATSSTASATVGAGGAGGK
jgi:hypothetical protein